MGAECPQLLLLGVATPKSRPIFWGFWKVSPALLLVSSFQKGPAHCPTMGGLCLEPRASGHESQGHFILVSSILWQRLV